MQQRQVAGIWNGKDELPVSLSHGVGKTEETSPHPGLS